MDQKAYCVKYRRPNGETTIIAIGCVSMAEAAEVALRLTVLQEREVGGTSEFCAEAYDDSDD
jgi:hypothetical protein